MGVGIKETLIVPAVGPSHPAWPKARWESVAVLGVRFGLAAQAATLLHLAALEMVIRHLIIVPQTPITPGYKPRVIISDYYKGSLFYA